MSGKFFFAIIFLFAQSVFAHHTGAIRGKIFGAETQTALARVSVSIAGTKIGAISDSSGQFIISSVPDGSYYIAASSVGYKKETIQVMIRSGDTAVVKFSLSPVLTLTQTVSVEANHTYSAASSKFLRGLDFELMPKNSAQDMLRLVPGLIIAQHAGGGKAEQIFIRGFDADHGTDVNISVDGIPVNMVSHGHGQGYADLHFIIPETVSGIDVSKGPYFAQFGDFATAGAISYHTKDFLEKNFFQAEGGLFGAARTLIMMKIPAGFENSSSYIAGEFFRNDGYFQSSQNLNRYNLFGKFNAATAENSSLNISASAFGSSWRASGQIPERAVANRIITRFGSLDDSEGGTTQRKNVNIQYSTVISDNIKFQARGFASDYDFQLYSNFTFFANDSVKGDQIEQTDKRKLFGGEGKFLFTHNATGVPAIGTFGTSIRSDYINNELWRTQKQLRLGAKSISRIGQHSAGVFLTEEFFFSEKFQLQLGLRADHFNFYLEDLIENSNGGKQQTILSPKFNLSYSLLNNLQLFLNAGSGFHSNDTRVSATHPNMRTLPRALGSETGANFRPTENLMLSAALWLLDLESEFIYVGDEGTTEPSGATRRVGFDLDMRYQILPWLWADAGIYFSHGRFKDSQAGENFIPLAPSFTSSGGISIQHPYGFECSLRYRHVADRPANESNSVTALGYMITDAVLSYKSDWYRVGITAENIFNIQWNEAQFDTESRLLNENEPVSELHFTPGTPLNVRTIFAVYF